MNKKHHTIYFDENNNLIHTTPKEWARANRDCFGKYNFLNNENTPVTETINRFLIENRGFNRIESATRVICIKF